MSALNSNIGTQIGSSQGNTSSSGSSFLSGLYGGINSMFNIADALMFYCGGVLDGLLSLLGSQRFDNFQTKLSTVSKWMAGIGV
ncbi:MAG: hypothetical protein ACI32E_07170 [Bacilli bacterium]